MGGRGGSSGISSRQEKGFQYNYNGKTMTVIKTLSGIVLVNGTPQKIDFEKILDSSKEKSGFKKLSQEEIIKKRKKRYEDFNSHDYELRGKNRRKTIYRPRRGT